MWFIYSYMAVLVSFPVLALIPAIIFLILYRGGKSPVVLLAAIAWGVYALYESLIIYRVICSGECNIRIDLLRIFPTLLGLSALALVMVAIRAWRRRPDI
ncbi:MAG: hypothetical protein K8F25_18685 [Fimbriimonadaceae bacterium]|nr:hypothetical protein [Alphaproteobacteria bacterium]